MGSNPIKTNGQFFQLREGNFKYLPKRYSKVLVALNISNRNIP